MDLHYTYVKEMLCHKLISVVDDIKPSLRLSSSLAIFTWEHCILVTLGLNRDAT